MWQRVVLIGFSGTGKSTIARRLSQHTGWRVIDLDDDLERHFGMTIPEVFAGPGEEVFRQKERELLAHACQEQQVIVATGGGAPADDNAWSSGLLGSDRTLTVTLDASPEISLQRLQAQHEREGDAVRRPMLEGDDPRTRIANLKKKRQAFYDRATITLPVDNLDPEMVVAEIAALLVSAVSFDAPDVTLEAPGGASRIFVRAGLLNEAGQLARMQFPRARRAWVVSDANVVALHSEKLTAKLAESDFETQTIVVPAGEASKSISGISQIYDAMLPGGVERGDIVVALGGGVIGDLAGFVASTILRGIGLVQIPTSLLAMVDSSIGGKTGINHHAGKNLIGSFYQPPLVVIDPALLRTLPRRELMQGWAEVIKHAVIQESTPGGARADLLSFLERNAGALHSLAEPATSYLIRRNVDLKARVVEADERESGIRAYLNFGHTLGHAIEASDYSLLHGEAVAIGMRAAANLSMHVNDVPSDMVARVSALLDAFDLPRTTAVDVQSALAKMKSDKKRVAGEQRWVLMSPAGGVEMRTGVSGAAVRVALLSVTK